MSQDTLSQTMEWVVSYDQACIDWSGKGYRFWFESTLNSSGGENRCVGFAMKTEGAARLVFIAERFTRFEAQYALIERIRTMESRWQEYGYPKSNRVQKIAAW